MYALTPTHLAAIITTPLPRLAERAHVAAPLEGSAGAAYLLDVRDRLSEWASHAGVLTDDDLEDVVDAAPLVDPLAAWLDLGAPASGLDVLPEVEPVAALGVVASRLARALLAG